MATSSIFILFVIANFWEADMMSTSPELRMRPPAAALQHADPLNWGKDAEDLSGSHLEEVKRMVAQVREPVVKIQGASLAITQVAAGDARVQLDESVRDLAPLSYVSGLITGRQNSVVVAPDGRKVDAAEAFKIAGIEHGFVKLQPKEGLAMVKVQDLDAGPSRLAGWRGLKYSDTGPHRQDETPRP